MMLLNEWAIFAEFIFTYFSHQFWDGDFFLPKFLIVLSAIVIECLIFGSAVVLEILLFLE